MKIKIFPWGEKIATHFKELQGQLRALRRGEWIVTFFCKSVPSNQCKFHPFCIFAEVWGRFQYWYYPNITLSSLEAWCEAKNCTAFSYQQLEVLPWPVASWWENLGHIHGNQYLQAKWRTRFSKPWPGRSQSTIMSIKVDKWNFLLGEKPACQMNWSRNQKNLSGRTWFFTFVWSSYTIFLQL